MQLKPNFGQRRAATWFRNVYQLPVTLSGLKLWHDVRARLACVITRGGKIKVGGRGKTGYAEITGVAIKESVAGKPASINEKKR